ncbi:hypothetical protein PAE9249_04971 [Paenibacillus sp. CECT 9249]|nr:DUF2634 domain-containing protein [Paenibacillus sp. CECT 9249]MBU5445189.1 DUF2634 domain-containing protein [Paenibacillus sp. MSJ-34]CAH0122421.1 hypothetical protein PAE9249_04971 [Paenibacillus sp. CECT 9249]
MAVPQGATLHAGDELEIVRQPSLTYRIDWKNKRIAGMIDDLDAIRQAVVKILQTERFLYLIYTTDYGTEWNGLLGKDRLYVQSELKRRVREALLQDERITDVDDFRFRFDGDAATVAFTVVSIYGSFEQEVRRNG